MTWVFDLLIAFLTELRAASLINQVMSILGFIGLLSAVFVYPVLRMRRRAESTLNTIELLRGRAETAEAANTRLTTERDAAMARLPEAFLTAHATEMRDHNEERAMALAERYIADQQDALSLAVRTRMDEAIRQSPQDGAPAFETALLWARAAQALAPQDRQLLMLIDDLRSAASAAVSGARVKLKDDDSRAERLARNERLPMDVAALSTAFFTARDRGEYTLMLFLADHGLTITRRPPFGEGSKQHLLFQRHKAEALSLVGRAQEAGAACISLIPDFISAFGDRDPETLYLRHQLAECHTSIGESVRAIEELDTLLPLITELLGARHEDVLATRYLLARCHADNGDSTEAQQVLEPLLPLMTEVLNSRHPHVLATRTLLAECRNKVGDTPGALKELETLQTLRAEVQGARHPQVLYTRTLLARCRADSGDSTEALAELDTLLPLMTEVQGPRHPHVLVTRLLRAEVLADLGRPDEAVADLDEIEQGLDAAGLLPRHRYRTRLKALRDRLSAPPSPDPSPDV